MAGAASLSTLMFKTTLLKLAFVLAFALQGGACTGPLSTEKRSCPCVDGYQCCPLTNQCLQPGFSCAPFALAIDHAMVRQGGVVKVTITAPDLSELTDLQLTDNAHDRALAIPSPNLYSSRGVFEWTIDVPHGADLGVYDLQFAVRNGTTTHRSASVITVSPIAVAYGGNDQGPGTTKEPFLTLEKAISDPILMSGDTLQVAAGTTAGLAGGGPIALPAGVTLQGEPILSDPFRAVDSRAAHVHGEIRPLGNLTISNLDLDGRVVVTGPGSVISLANIRSEGTDVGVRVHPEAVGASVLITGGATSITSIYLPPVWIEASDVHLKIRGGVVISNEAQSPALRLDGDKADVDIRAVKLSTKGGDVIYAARGGTVVMNDVQVRGMVSLGDPGMVADMFMATFNTADLSTGGLTFWGASLSLQDCMFHLVSLQQGNPQSRVVIRNTTFSGYLESAVSLEAGSLDLGNAVTQGDNQFETSTTRSGPPPVALSVRAKAGTASVSMSTSRVNGRLPPPRWVMGPAKDDPYYQIENMVPIQMY